MRFDRGDTADERHSGSEATCDCPDEEDGQAPVPEGEFDQRESEEQHHHADAQRATRCASLEQ